MTQTATAFDFTPTKARLNLTAPKADLHTCGKSELAYAEKIATALKGPIVGLCGADYNRAPGLIADLAQKVLVAGESAQVLAQEGNYGMNNGIKSRVADFANELSNFGPLLNAAKKTPDLRPLDIHLIVERAEKVLKSIFAVLPEESKGGTDWSKDIKLPA